VVFLADSFAPPAAAQEGKTPMRAGLGRLFRVAGRRHQGWSEVVRCRCEQMAMRIQQMMVMRVQQLVAAV